MPRNVWIALACLVVGLPLAAWGLASGHMLFGLLGLALVLVFVYLVIEALNKAANPKIDIPKSPDAAWNLKDQPAAGNPLRQDPPAPQGPKAPPGPPSPPGAGL